MEVISDISVLGKAAFRSSSEFHEDASFWNSSNTGVALRSPEGVAGYLGLVYDNEPLPRTAFWEGDLEIGALGKTAVDAEKGFLRVGTCDGEPVGTPRSIGSGTPVVFNSVSESLYAYSGGWKQMAGGTKSVGYRSSYVPHWNFAGDLVPGTIEDTGHGIVFLGGRLEPAPHGISGTIGISTNKWDAVYAKEVYTDLISAPLLATNEHGKIVLSDVTPGGGGTGNVSTDGGTQYRLASWLTANKLGDSPLVVDAADVTSRGSISPASGFAVGLGSNSVPWKSMYATDVYALSAKSESILSTGADGRIQGGSLPAATTSVIGGIIVGQNLSVSGSGVLGATLPAHPVSEHSDVQYPSPPADNQMLGWNAASSKWENRVVPSMAHSLSSHTDVNLSAVVVGQVLTYVGGLERWKNVTPVVGVSKAYGNYAKLNADNTTAGVAGVDLDTNDNVQDWPINLGTAAAANETRIAEEDGVSIATGNVLTVGEAGLYVFGMSADMFNLGIVSPMYADKLFFVIKRADGTLKETPMAVHSGDATHVDGKNTSMALDLNKDEAVTYQVRYVTKDSKVHTAQVFGLRLTVHRAA